MPHQPFSGAALPLALALLLVGLLRPGGDRSAAAPVSRPTATPTAAATATPQAATPPPGTTVPSAPPTPTAPASDDSPLAAAGGVELLGYRVIPSPTGGVDILGAVRNTTTGWVRPLTTTVTFLDETGEAVAVAGAAPLLALVGPGETMPIRGHADLEPGAWAREEITPGDARPVRRAERRVFAEDVSVADLDESASTPRRLVLAGRLANGGEVAAHHPAVSAAVFDGAGAVVAIAETHPTPAPLFPGQSAPFTLAADVDAAPGWTYRLYFDALAGT